MSNLESGKLGEKAAVKYLKKKGYKILDVNLKSKTGEIDIVAEDKGIIVFIEVKTRSSYEFGSPSEAVNGNRIRRYINSAKMYINNKRLAGRDIRFDVIEVLDDEINHLEDAFRKS